MGRALDVLLFGALDRTEGLADALENLGIRCRGVRPDSPAPRVDREWAAGVILAETQSDIEDALTSFDRFWPTKRPVIAVVNDSLDECDGVDSWLRMPAPAVQVAARIRALFRLHVMEEVAALRSQSSALYGQRKPVAERAETPACVLYVGEASPRFMALQHALNTSDTEVVAAFSSYSAFDYLHERSFDAVVLNALEKRDTAFTISSAMRRNARLYHTPVLLLASDGNAEGTEEAFARGVSDILPPEASDAEIRERVLSLAGERRRRREAKAQLEACRDPRSLDVDTGLFHAGFLTSHLQNLLDAEMDRGLNFSILALNLSLPEGPDQPDDTSAEKARRQFAAMLRHLLRTEDAAARIGSDRFVAVLPYTDLDGVECVSARVSAIAECTAFESDDPLRPFRLSVMSVPLQPQPGDTAESLLERAIRQLVSRSDFAARA